MEAQPSEDTGNKGFEEGVSGQGNGYLNVSGYLELRDQSEEKGSPGFVCYLLVQVRVTTMQLC